MADLVIGYDPLLFVGEDGVLLLISGDDGLDALLQVRLGHQLPAVPHRSQGGLVDDVGQLRAGCAGGHPGHGGKVHVLRQLDLLGVDLQNFLPPLQVRQLHRHPAVKPARTGQRGVQGLRAVGGRQDDHAGVIVEAVHLRQQLVQGLLPLIVAAVLAAAALLADGVDLVDEHDAGGLLLGLAEQVPDLGRAHAHEHLHKLRAGDGEEGHLGLACHGLGQHGLAGSRRAHQQDALGHGCADLLILTGVMEIVHDLLQVLLGLILAGHVGKVDALGGLHIDLGIGLPGAEHHGAGASGPVRQLLGHQLADGDEHDDGQDPRQHKAQQRRGLLYNVPGELRSGVIQPLGQVRVVHGAGLIDLAAVLVGEDDLVVLHLHLADLLVFGHGHEGAVVHLLHRVPGHQGHQQKVDQQQHH